MWKALFPNSMLFAKFQADGQKTWSDSPLILEGKGDFYFEKTIHFRSLQKFQHLSQQSLSKIVGIFKNKNVKKSVKTSPMTVFWICRMAKSLFWLMNKETLKISNCEWSRWLGKSLYSMLDIRMFGLLKWWEKRMMNTIYMLFSTKAFSLFTSVPFTDCFIYFFQN